jgi:hypothetical protein
VKAAGLKMRAAEEPLKTDLDVARLKAQVLERIETLEEREDLERLQALSLEVSEELDAYQNRHGRRGR